MEMNDQGVLYRVIPSDQMDNNSGRYNNNVNSPTRNCDSRQIEETELGDLSGVIQGATPMNYQTGVSCYDGACKNQSSPRGAHPVHRLESPWHHLKTVFLVSIIISFIVWLIAYILLAQYGVV